MRRRGPSRRHEHDAAWRRAVWTTAVYSEVMLLADGARRLPPAATDGLLTDEDIARCKRHIAYAAEHGVSYTEADIEKAIQKAIERGKALKRDGA